MAMNKKRTQLEQKTRESEDITEKDMGNLRWKFANMQLDVSAWSGRFGTETKDHPVRRITPFVLIRAWFISNTVKLIDNVLGRGSI